jgi:hypothetical protein
MHFWNSSARASAELSIPLLWHNVVMRRAARANGLHVIATMALVTGDAGSSGCAPACENDVLNGMPSPDGRDIAFVFRRRCESRVSTDVSVIDLHRTLKDEPGNVLAVAGEQAPRVIWRGPSRLEITGFRPPVLLRNSHASGVDVLFRGADDDAVPSP